MAETQCDRREDHNSILTIYIHAPHSMAICFYCFFFFFWLCVMISRLNPKKKMNIVVYIWRDLHKKATNQINGNQLNIS